MKFLLPFLSALLLAGCVVIPSKQVTFNDIQVGMERAEAIKILGKPNRVSAKGNVEHLYYNESALYIGVFGVGKIRDRDRKCEMRLVDGKIVSFGELGEDGEVSESEEGEQDN